MAPSGPQRHCETCNRKFTRPVGSNRLNCYTCRPVRATVVQLSPVDDPLSLAALSQKALEEAGAWGTWQAAAAMALARLIDSGRHGAGGASGNIRAHREALAYALQDGGNDAAVLDIVDRIFAADTPK
jgi:hypothetical protein